MFEENVPIAECTNCCINHAAAHSNVPPSSSRELAPFADRICHPLRYVTREDVAAASLSKASSSGGSVRLISKGMGASLDKGAAPEPSAK